jgi:hypothetical protein
MAGSALGRTYLGPIDTRLDVATRTGRHGVGLDTVKAYLDVPGGRRPRLPAYLAMAALAVRSERGGMGVGVTAGTAAGGIRRNRPPVIMTPKAGSLRVSPLQVVSRFFRMVEGEVSP